jgi:hypothetical protein
LGLSWRCKASFRTFIGVSMAVELAGLEAIRRVEAVGVRIRELLS